MPRLPLFVLVPIFAALTGCVSAPAVAPAPTADPIISRLDKTSAQVEMMLAEMNALERSRLDQPGQWKTAAEVLPSDHPMMRRITAIWSGDVRLVIRKLADQFGMDVVVKGKSPTPVMVAVTAKDQPFVSILETIGAQTGNIANITCDVSANLLQIEYR